MAVRDFTLKKKRVPGRTPLLQFTALALRCFVYQPRGGNFHLTMSGRRYINHGRSGVSNDKLSETTVARCDEHVLRNSSMWYTPLPRLRQIEHCLIESLDKQFWVNIYSIEVTSNECLAKIRTLLGCRSNMNVARSFQGNEAQTFIDFLDQVSDESSVPCTGSLVR